MQVLNKKAEKELSYLEGSLMPQAKFLSESYILALKRYNWVAKFIKNKIVLDAGCGSGYGTDKLAHSGAKKVYGIDLYSESIKYSKAHYHRQNLYFMRSDLSKTKFPNNFFDVITAFEVIEHLKNYKKAISECRRILKPGGRLILSTPNKQIYSPGTKKTFYPFHEHEFYLTDLKKTLKDFKIKKILGQYIKNRKMLNYPVWHPKRTLRIIYANLPLNMKIKIMRWYLKIYFWVYNKNIYHPKTIELSDVYFSKNLNKTRIFVAICQKPK